MKNRKEVIGVFIIITLFILVLVTYLLCYKYKYDNNSNKNLFVDSSNYLIYIYDDNSFVKVSDLDTKIDNNKVVGKYNCKYDDCDIYENTSFSPIYDSKYIVLKENNKIFIYNYIDDIMSDLYDGVVNKLNNYYVVKNNDKLGLIDINGNNIIDTIYDFIDIENIYNNLIKVGNDGLFGVYNIKDKSLLINTLYSDILITNSTYFGVLKDNLWYVIDKNNNIITNSYLKVYPFSKGFIALIDNNLVFLKYKKEETKLIDDVIFVNDKYNVTVGIREITIDTPDKIYKYNINRNSLN